MTKLLGFTLCFAAAGCTVQSAVSESNAAVTQLQGIDYSWARPSPSGIAGGGYSFVARYFDYSSGGGKILSKPEADSLIAAGLNIVITFEDGAQNALGGYNQGVADANQAAAQVGAVGMPGDRPIYFAVDFDATPGDQTAIDAYFDGVASVLGRNRTGMYGGYWPMSRAFNNGKISWGWQTYAWSGGNWDSRAQLRQVNNGITVAGDANCCDADTSVADDFGQWGQARSWEAKYVSQSWPLASTAMTMKCGDSVPANIVLRNAGSQSWDSSTRLGTTQPRDRSSVFVASDWLGPNRASAVSGTVPPGGQYQFNFTFQAPSGSACQPGQYHEFFSVVQESVAWFSDPGQGGPPDNQIEAWIDLQPAPPPPPPPPPPGDDMAGPVATADAGDRGASDGGVSSPGDDAGAGKSIGGGGGGGGGSDGVGGGGTMTPPGQNTSSGCSVGGAGSDEPWLALALACVLVALLRRQRAARLRSDGRA